MGIPILQGGHPRPLPNPSNAEKRSTEHPLRPVCDSSPRRVAMRTMLPRVPGRATAAQSPTIREDMQDRDAGGTGKQHTIDVQENYLHQATLEASQHLPGIWIIRLHL